MKALIAAVVAACVACSRTDDDSVRLARLETAAASQSQAADRIAERAAQLDEAWHDIAEGYETTSRRHVRAQAELSRAERLYGGTASQFVETSVAAERAATRWRLFQALVVAAAAIDAANLDSVRATHAGDGTKGARATCGTGMSTAAYRALMMARGVALDGMDIDHIVPHSLGGADHPDNYQLLPASVNRSLGNTWNEDKCFAVGESRCAKAIAVSRKCGGLHGLGFN